MEVSLSTTSPDAAPRAPSGPLPAYLYDLRARRECESHCDAVGIWASRLEAGYDIFDARTWPREGISPFYYTGEALVEWQPLFNRARESGRPRHQVEFQVYRTR